MASVTKQRRTRGRPPSASNINASAASVREVLLAAAVRLFSDNEYEAIGIRDLAEAAGVTLSAVYHHFGDKRGLYAAANLHVMHAITDRLLAAISRGGDPRRRLFNFTVEFVEVCALPEYIMVERRHLVWSSELVNLEARLDFQRQVRVVADAASHLTEGRDGTAVALAIYAQVHGLHFVRPVAESLPGPAILPTDPKETAVYVLSTILPQIDWHQLALSDEKH